MKEEKTTLINLLPTQRATMSSLEIATLTGKRHDHVLDDCRKLADFYAETYSPEKAGELIMKSTYLDPTGRTLPCMNLSRDASLDLVTGYNSLSCRHKVNQRWMALESSILRDIHAALNDPTFLRRLLLEYTENLLDLQAKVAEQAPKVASFERFIDAEGTVSLTDAAKILGVQPGQLFKKLNSTGWIYRRMPNSPWSANQDRILSGFLTQKAEVGKREDGSPFVSHTVRVTSKGMEKMRGFIY